MIRIIPLPRSTSFVVVFKIPHQAFNVCLAQCSMFLCVHWGEAKLVVVVFILFAMVDEGVVIEEMKKASGDWKVIFGESNSKPCT
jgi:hypothetical protein